MQARRLNGSYYQKASANEGGRRSELTMCIMVTNSGDYDGFANSLS